MWEESALSFLKDFSQKEKFPSLKRKKPPPWPLDNIPVAWPGGRSSPSGANGQAGCPRAGSTGSQKPSSHLPLPFPQAKQTHTQRWTTGELSPDCQTDKMDDLCRSGFFPPVRIKEETTLRAKPRANSVPPQPQMRHREGEKIYGKPKI